jgi:hypothetical protein
VWRCPASQIWIGEVNQVKREAEAGEEAGPLAESSPQPRRRVWQRRHCAGESVDILAVLVRLGMQDHDAGTGVVYQQPRIPRDQIQKQSFVALARGVVWGTVEPDLLRSGYAIEKPLQESVVGGVLGNSLDRPGLYAYAKINCDCAGERCSNSHWSIVLPHRASGSPAELLPALR